MTLKNHAIAPIRKERLSPISKAMREASRNKFVEKGEVPDRAERFGEVDSNKNCPRARLEFVKPFRNGWRKRKNLIESRPLRTETELAGRENGVRHQKEK